METHYILIGIIALFFIFLIAKILFVKNKKESGPCVICAAISLTWITLIILYFANKFENIIIISLLLGMSLTGIYRLTEQKIKKEKLKIFRLPFILTLITFAYYILTFENPIKNIFIVTGLWILFILFYASKNLEMIKKLLECCKE